LHCLRRPVRGLNRIASASPGLKELSMLQSLLADCRPLLADAATGANLFAMGLTSGDAPELWNAEHPDRIESLHQVFVLSGPIAGAWRCTGSRGERGSSIGPFVAPPAAETGADRPRRRERK
jgi:hypothetical protein